MLSPLNDHDRIVDNGCDLENLGDGDGVARKVGTVVVAKSPDDIGWRHVSHVGKKGGGECLTIFVYFQVDRFALLFFR